MKRSTPCPLCLKDLVLVREFTLGDQKLNEYKCGHVFSHDVTRVSLNSLKLTSVDGSGKQARPYQQEGVQFIIESDFNMILGDQMRLGKTPQALLALQNFYKERTPALIIVKPANLWQWTREYKVWCDSLPNGIFPILSTTAWIPAGFSAYIISMDTFGANSKCTCGHRFHEKNCKSGHGPDEKKKSPCSCQVYQSDGQGIRDKLKLITFKLVIADEAHSYKNTDSNRSRALVDFMHYINIGETDLSLNFSCSACGCNWTEEEGKLKFDKRIGHKVISKSTRCPLCNQYCYIRQQRAEENIAPSEKPCGLLLLTGTAIVNRAEEYFVPLNLIAPEKFSSLQRFRNAWLAEDGKRGYSRVKSYRLDAFKKEIAPYVLRREKEDVFTELPPLNRIFTIIEPEKESYAKLYNSVLDKMEASMVAKANPSFFTMAEDLMELRRLCGMMKLSWTADYLEISLTDSEKQKFAVGLHHETVREVLYNKLGGSENCWKFSGAESADRKNYIEQNYTHMKQRVGILNMLAGGVGCDFHEIDTILILERQWSSAMEEQFEFRFYNPDLKIKNRSTTVEYIIAKGTIDEIWYDMVEEKRRIFGETIANNWNIEQDGGSFKSLMDKTLAARLQ